MKKIIKFSVLVCFVVLFCCGCEGDVTRAFRHAGFSLSNSEFVCNAFFNNEGLTENIKYLTGTHIITDYGRIYELSLGTPFSNSQNCKVAETDLKVESIMDNSIFKAENGRIYKLAADNEGPAYSEITSTNSSYDIYRLLLSDVSVIKVQSVDTQNGIYYVLKSDGNVYGYNVVKPDRNQAAYIAGQSVVYNKADYGGEIIDYGYSGNSEATFVRTAERVFHMVMDNAEECTKYADIACTYHMEEAPVFTEQGKYIKAYNGSTIITTYNKVFTLGNAS